MRATPVGADDSSGTLRARVTKRSRRRCGAPSRTCVPCMPVPIGRRPRSLTPNRTLGSANGEGALHVFVAGDGARVGVGPRIGVHGDPPIGAGGDLDVHVQVV